MSAPLCRWGILGTANIARKNWKAIRLAGNAALVAVASRDAAVLSNISMNVKRGFPHAGPRGMRQLRGTDRPEDIDAVYIPLPTGFARNGP